MQCFGMKESDSLSRICDAVKNLGIVERNIQAREISWLSWIDLEDSNARQAANNR